MAGCSSPARKVDPGTLLRAAEADLDHSSAVHFSLDGSDVTTSGTSIAGGEGDLVRPDEMKGTFKVTVNGFVADVMVVSDGGVFEALLPFQPHFEKANPSTYGLTDPANLMNPTTGLTNVLAIAEEPRLMGSERIDGELLDTVAFTVPGADVPVLPDADPTVPVTLVAAIDPRSDQLRQISITGPLTTKSHDTTYAVTLTRFDEHVNITLPPTS